MTSTASAAPFEPSLVSGRATHLLYLDLDRARKSSVGKAVIDYLANDPGYRELETMLNEHAGIMPLEDIDDLTCWSESGGPDMSGVALVRGRFDATALRPIIASADEFEAERVGDVEILSWKRDDAPGYGFMIITGKHELWVSGNAPAIRRAIEVRGDVHESMQTAEQKLPTPAEPWPWLFACGNGLGKLFEPTGNTALQQIGTVLIEAGESDADHFTLRTTAIADEENAKKIYNLGVLALSLRQRGPTDDPAEQAKRSILDAMTIERDGEQVRLIVKLTSESAVEIVNKLLTGSWR